MKIKSKYLHLCVLLHVTKKGGVRIRVPPIVSVCICGANVHGVSNGGTYFTLFTGRSLWRLSATLPKQNTVFIQAKRLVLYVGGFQNLDWSAVTICCISCPLCGLPWTKTLATKRSSTHHCGLPFCDRKSRRITHSWNWLTVFLFHAMFVFHYHRKFVGITRSYLNSL
jgi:hypothetical protein